MDDEDYMSVLLSPLTAATGSNSARATMQNRMLVQTIAANADKRQREMQYTTSQLFEVLKQTTNDTEE